MRSRNRGLSPVLWAATRSVCSVHPPYCDGAMAEHVLLAHDFTLIGAGISELRPLILPHSVCELSQHIPRIVLPSVTVALVNIRGALDVACLENEPVGPSFMFSNLATRGPSKWCR